MPDFPTISSFDVVSGSFNLLVNGGFERWQRGVGAFTGDGTYGADRWLNSVSSGDTLSVSQDTSHVDVASAACAACTYTKSTGGSTLYQLLEDYVQLQAKTISLSVRVQTSTASCARARIWGVHTSSVYSSYHSGGGTYETLTVTATIANPEATVRCGVQLDASATVYVDNAMLVLGSVPVDYTLLTPTEDWARCLRYYQILGVESNGNLLLEANASVASEDHYVVLPYYPKAVAPTLTKVGTWAVANCAQPDVQSSGLTTCRLHTTSIGNGQLFTSNNSAGCYITLEANP